MSEVELKDFLQGLKNSEKRLDTIRSLRLFVTQNDVTTYKEEFISDLETFLSDDDELTRRLCWQVIYNSCVNRNQMIDFTLLKLKSTILSKLQSEVPKTQNVICALIYLKLGEFTDLDNFKILLGLSQLCDFALLSCIALLEYDHVLENIEKLSSDEKVQIYEMCQDSLENGKISEKVLKFLVQCLKNKNSTLLMTFNKDFVCPIETSRLLMIICKASSEEKWQNVLQNDKSLLIDAIYILRMMHDAEKSSGSIQSNFDLQIEDSPTNGFKCNLIRLIGNLCYRNKENQDEVCLYRFYYYY